MPDIRIDIRYSDQCSERESPISRSDHMCISHVYYRCIVHAPSSTYHASRRSQRLAAFARSSAAVGRSDAHLRSAAGLKEPVV